MSECQGPRSEPVSGCQGPRSKPMSCVRVSGPQE